MIPASLRRQVITRALNCCEYCSLSQLGQEATFHVDHVIPLSNGGPTNLENLALARVSCSLRKGAATIVFDSVTGQDVAIFNPRRHKWNEHFRWSDVEVVGFTPTGRGTVSHWQLNRPLILEIRQEEKNRKRHPPI